MKNFFKVVTPKEAYHQLAQANPGAPESIDVVKARGRVLANDLFSAVDLPHFHRAGMDGFAVRAKDTFGASATLPAYLKLTGTVDMGKDVTQSVAPGETMRISTGGMLPPECDAVVMVEYTEELDNGTVEIQRAVAPWQNVIQIGDDIRKGDLVFPRGRRLRAHDLGALTGIGVSSVEVFKKPRIALISTGDEIIDAASEPGPGQVRNINQHSLAGLIEEWGAELHDYGVVRDDRQALEQTINRALIQADSLFLSGGSSVGARDITLDAILAMPEAKIFFHGISVSPGKPTIYAEACGKPILGLPGYPVSALVIFDLFAVPLLRRLSGETLDEAEHFHANCRAILKTNVASQSGREDYVRVSLERASDKLYATPLPNKSGAIFTLVKADGMIRIELNQEGVEAGEEVDVMLF
ncbi:MAG: molybdopterin molybdenumtransferase MoeA [Deltaproteobacteria bacterium]|nr:molybdopterin molybdenumtransferase MoeA [Deltaproteobacteria bacterium]